MNDNISEEVYKEINEITSENHPEQRSSKNKKVLTFLLLIVFLIFLTVLVFIRKNLSLSNSNVKVNTVREPVSVSHLTEENYWNPDTKNEIFFSFTSMPDPAPKYIELNISFDPKIVTVESVTPGNVWSSSTALTNKIDNEKGEVILGIGQGFSADLTGNFQILKLNVVTQKVNADDEAVFVVLPSSYYSSSDSTKVPFNNSILKYEARIPVKTAIAP